MSLQSCCSATAFAFKEVFHRDSFVRTLICLLLLNCTLVFAVMTSCFELYSVFIHTNPPFAVLGDDVGLKVLGDEDGERVGLADGDFDGC